MKKNMIFKKENVISFILELVVYIIVLAILELIACKAGLLKNTSIIANTIAMTSGWLLWKIIITLINGRKK